MQSPIRWGILGLGKIAQKFADDLEFSENGILLAVASRVSEKAKAFAKKYDVEKAYTSYESLLNDPEIDVVYIATPHVFHKEWTIKSLQKGKHVLCEKPMGMNAKEVEEMISEAQKNNRFLMEGIWTRFIPATDEYLRVKDEIGEIISIRADFGFEVKFDSSHRTLNKSLGGGSLLDVGIYPVYLSLLTLGKPKEIHAIARFTETGVDASCWTLFEYESGAVANLDSSFEMETSTEARIYGKKGSVYLHPRFHHTQKISQTMNGNTVSWCTPYIGHGYIHEIEEVQVCLLTGKLESEKLPLSMSLDLAETLDRVREKIGLDY